MKSLVLSFLYFFLTINLSSTFVCAAQPGTPAGFARKTVVVEPSTPSYTRSISQYGITWTFSKSVQYGRFISGDYYVVDPGGGIVVSSVSPGWTGSRNGSMKNPTPRSAQGFDSSGDKYSAASRVSFPLSLSGGDALISTISVTSEKLTWAGTGINSSNKVRDAAVLTVLSSPPANPAITFRPSPVDRKQTLYTTAKINKNILGGLSTAGITLPSHSGFTPEEYFVRGTARPWLLWGNDWQARAIHPTNNMFWYHEYIGSFLSEMMMMIMSDRVTDDMINGFCQIVIDYYHAGNADSCVWAAPYVLGGLLLNEPSIYNYWINHPTIRTQRGHEKLFYPEDDPAHDDWKVSSIVPKNKIWTGYVHPVSGRSPMFSKQTGAYGKKYYEEHLHPSEWVEDSLCTSGTESQCKGEVYRTQHDVYPLVGMTLATIIADRKTSLDVNAMLAHDVIRDYMDRWMTEDFMNGKYKNTGRTFNEEMRYYRHFTTYFYNYMTSKSKFIDDMWHTYR